MKLRYIITAIVIVAYFMIAGAQYNEPCFKMDIQLYSTDQWEINSTINQETKIPLENDRAISGLSINGISQLEDSPTAFIRITLIDVYGAEYLVYETYPQLIGDKKQESISNVAIETKALNKVTPEYLKINVNHAMFQLQAINTDYTRKPEDLVLADIEESAELQNQAIVDRLNLNLANQGKLWRAKSTSMSRKSYREKKLMFGDSVPELYGFEYYGGGIFEIPSEITYKMSDKDSILNSKLVKELDWRNRHGRNWMTPVKNQGCCLSCWAFATCAAIETYINLYYNKPLNYDLSEQQLASCMNYYINDDNNWISCKVSGKCIDAIWWIRDNGIVCEKDFPYVQHDQKCIDLRNPTDRIKINSGHFFPYNNRTIKLKRTLYNNPITFGIVSWQHACCLCGYKLLTLGDKITVTSTYAPGVLPCEELEIDANSEYLGKTAWLVKNSWGQDFGDDGYAYVILESDFDNDRNVYMDCVIGGQVQSEIYSDDDCVATDFDGDGYFFWGTGPKPKNLPSWASLLQDGDDDNYKFGNIDNYGGLEPIEIKNDLIINCSTDWQEDRYLYNNVIVDYSTLNIDKSITLYPDCDLYLKNGGTLIIDGGILSVRNLIADGYCSIVLKNNAKINLYKGGDAKIPKGSNLLILDGSKIIQN